MVESTIKSIIDPLVGLFSDQGPTVGFLIVTIIFCAVLMLYLKIGFDRFLDAVNRFTEETKQQREACKQEKESIIQLHEAEKAILRENRVADQSEFLKAMERITESVLAKRKNPHE